MNPSKQKRILVVEDELKIATLMADYLQRDGFAVQSTNDGDAAMGLFAQFAPDLVLLDLMLPGKDGLQICREIREQSNVPIIMVTARVDEIDRLLGLEIGADDYICKPFSPRELVARVKTVLRRVVLVNTARSDYRGVQVDEQRFQATVDDTPMDLTPVEFRLLCLMLAQPGRVYSRQQLIERVYDDGRVVGDRTVDSHVKNLRRKIRELTGSDDLIHSVYGVGYKLE